MKMRSLGLFPKPGSPRSILGKLLLPFGLVMGAIALFMFLYFPAAMEERAMAALHEKGRSIAAMAAFNAEAGVSFSDTLEIQKALAGALETPEVVRVDVRGLDGANLARLDRLDADATPDRGPEGDGAMEFLPVTEPVLIRGSRIGEVEVFLSLDELRTEVALARAIVGLLAFLIFITGVGSLAALSAVITRPLRSIVKAAQEISRGDLTHRASVTTNDEIGVLAGSFNDMVSKLHASRIELEEVNRSLEDRVARRTAALLKSEAELEQIRKMEAVGRLAGGVAHDFNNLLGVIRGHVDLLFLEQQEANGDTSQLEAIRTAADQAADLTRQLLAFGRRQVLRPQSIDPNQLLADATEMLERVVGEHIRVESRLDPVSGQIEADPGQLERALLNLALNARDAMPKGGTLTLETRSVDETQVSDLWGAALPKGRYSVLLVRDDGEGIPEENLPRVFEPFFTTREFGEGSGLGLAMVEGIVSQSGGFIFIESELGVGTEVRLCFPAQPSGSSSGLEDQSLAREGLLVPGAETILIVEDDDLIRQTTGAILRQAGYTTLLASGPKEALSILESQGGSIDMVLSDVIMPDMTGDQLAERIGSLNPNIGLLFMSAHSGRVLEDVMRSGIPLVEKPFAADVLTRAVRSVLDERLAQIPG